MKQEKKFMQIVGGYFIDIDLKGQFRIFGPNNHIYIALPQSVTKQFEVSNIVEKGLGGVEVTLKAKQNECVIEHVVQSDVRTFRASNGLEEGRIKTIDEMAEDKKLQPQKITVVKTKKQSHILYERNYSKYYYRTIFIVPTTVTIEKKGTTITLKNTKDSEITLIAETNDTKRYINLPEITLTKIAENVGHIKAFKADEKEIMKTFIEQSKREIQHMLEWGKTSGDRFGTVFPRDWMESADLGRDFLPQKTYEAMYERAMEHVNSQGIGWHEDVIGELLYLQRKEGLKTVNRDMIDIEPHYLMGLSYVSPAFIKRNKEKLEKIAAHVIKLAKKKKLVTFKKITKEIMNRRPAIESVGFEKMTYLPRGNWRDIPSSYGAMSEIIAPFDVNAVFIPAALKNIIKYKLTADVELAKELYTFWKDVKEEYKFTNTDGTVAFSLGKYDTDFKTLKVNHLDESYYFFYENATEEESVSFAKRVLDPQYLFTPSGPIITEIHNPMKLATRDYHGTVIWPKTTGFTVLGLYHQLAYGKKSNWSKKSLDLIEKAINTISQVSIRAYIKAGGVPELYFDKKGEPVMFNTQMEATEESSNVQLWSAMSYIAMVQVLHS